MNSLTIFSKHIKAFLILYTVSSSFASSPEMTLLESHQLYEEFEDLSMTYFLFDERAIVTKSVRAGLTGLE